MIIRTRRREDCGGQGARGERADPPTGGRTPQSAGRRRDGGPGSDRSANDDADRAENEGYALGRPTPRSQEPGAP
jgi:hypothetical protein